MTYYATADIAWLEELGVFAKAPAGVRFSLTLHPVRVCSLLAPQAFEHVVPNELTRIRMRLSSISLHVSAPTRPSHIVVHVSEAKARTDLMPDLPRTTLSAEVAGLRALAVDSDADLVELDGLANAGEEAWRHWRVRLPESVTLYRPLLTYTSGRPRALRRSSCSSGLPCRPNRATV